jgi:hypothetical protein
VDKLKYKQPLDVQQLDTIKMGSIRPKLHALKNLKLPRPMDVVCVLLSLLAFFLWAISLQHVSVYDMNDLGLISVLSPKIIIALVILMISFGFTLQQPRLKVSVLALHLIILIIILYGTENIIEEAPHFATVYRHEGYIEYILRNGSVLPNFDVYSSWPIFFVLGAFVTRAAGYQTILGYAGWAPVFYNLIYFGPIYMVFTSVTTNKRLIWLGLWFFYLTNWVQQDYFSPQGLNLFLYLVIIAILLKWFKIPPKVRSLVKEQRQQPTGLLSQLVPRFLNWLRASDPFFTPVQPWQRNILLVCLILIFGLVVSSHPLTPLSTLASVTALVVFQRCYPLWFPILMAIMIGAWFFLMAQPLLAGHLSLVTGDLGNVSSNVSSSVAARTSQGDPLHQFIALMRIIMTAFIWILAFLGVVRRLFKGYMDITYILLAVTPFTLIVAGSYGGEMFLRIYFFSLPIMVFFAASLFYNKHTLVIRKTSLLMTVAIIATNLVLLGGLFFTRYGNERVDYMTYKEFDSVKYFYSIAPPNSLLLEGWNDTPWEYQDDEKYLYYSMTDVIPDAVIHTNVSKVIKFIESQKRSHTYLIFTRSSKAASYSLDGLPSDMLDRLEDAMLKSGKFKMVYNNRDAQIFIFLGNAKGEGS